jgi:hypothetical protein
VAWATTAAVSPVVYVQPGDSGATFGHPGYRQLIGGAVDWVTSADAHSWARGRPTPLAGIQAPVSRSTTGAKASTARSPMVT